MPNTTTLNETLRSPIDGSEYVRLATSGANWKAQLSSFSKPQAASNLTFYVATTGSDSNTGTSAGSPFLTIQHALNVAGSYDWSLGFFPTINVAAGTYPNGGNSYSLPQLTGLRVAAFLQGKLIGDTVTPSNVILTDTSNANCINGSGTQASWIINGFEIDTNAVGIQSTKNADLECHNITFADHTNGGNMVCVEASQYGIIALNDAFAIISTNFQSLCVGGEYGDITIEPATLVFPVACTVTSGLIQLDSYSRANFFVTGSITNGGGVTGAQLSVSENATVLAGTALPGQATSNFADTTCLYLGIGIAGFFSSAVSGVPTTSNLLAGSWGVFKDTSGGGVYVAYNDAGTIKKVALV